MKWRRLPIKGIVSNVLFPRAGLRDGMIGAGLLPSNPHQGLVSDIYSASLGIGARSPQDISYARRRAWLFIWNLRSLSGLVVDIMS